MGNVSLRVLLEEGWPGQWQEPQEVEPDSLKKEENECPGRG